MALGIQNLGIWPAMSALGQAQLHAADISSLIVLIRSAALIGF